MFLTFRLDMAVSGETVRSHPSFLGLYGTVQIEIVLAGPPSGED